MQVDELNLSAQLKAKLAQAGFTTVAEVLAAGADGLEAIDGIGPKTAVDILTAVQEQAQAPQPPTSVPDTAKAPDSPTTAEPDPNEVITVRNISAAMILVGERYLLPTQTRTVRRRLIRHVPADSLLEI